MVLSLGVVTLKKIGSFMAAKSVGKEILSLCNKCKLTLAHLIITLKEDKSVWKVKCKTCNTTHVFKDPNSVKPSKKKDGEEAVSTPAEHKEVVSDVWQEAMKKAGSEVLKYSMTQKFQLGDIVEHPSFGKGVIDQLLDNNKIKVTFRTEIKVLMHNLKR